MSSFIEYQNTVSTSTYLFEMNVDSATDCAFLCTTEKKFKCKSFNLCEFNQQKDKKYKCLMSDTHNNYTSSSSQSSTLTYSVICKHYSSKIFIKFQ